MSRLGLSTSNSPTSLPAISVLSSSDSFSADSDNERSGDEPTSAQILQNIEDILEGSGSSSSSKEVGWQAARIKTKRKRSSAPRPVISNPIVEVSEPNTPSTSPPSNAGAILMQARAANGPVSLSPTSFSDSKWQSYSRQSRARSKSIGNVVDQTNLKIEGFATLALTPAKSIVRLILSRLDLTTITACLQVCRTWANLQNDKTFWNMVYKHYEARLKQRGEKNVNIWEASIEDKTIVEDKDGNIKFATLNGLVEKLTPAEHIPNTSDADALLTTYPTFTTAQQLVRKLFERYNVPPPANNKNLDDYAKNFVKPIQVRVCHILKKFVMWKYATLDRNLINVLKVVSKLMEDRLGVTLKYTIIKESMKLAEQHATPRASIAPKATAPATKPAKTGVKLLQPIKEKHGLLLHTNSELLAKQMTLIEFETYAVIQAQELIGESWNKKNKDQLSPNIRKMIDRFNYTTKSIVTLLLQEEKLKTRAKLFIKFIKIAAALRKLNNFHTLMAVLSGLNDGPIFRLKATKDQISPKWLKVWEELQSLMSHEGSYANYRHALSAAQPPCIPYIGIYLRDLVYIESNNAPEEVQVPDGIQFKQKKQVFSVIKLLQTYQEHPYAFEPNDELIQMLTTLPTVSDDELFTLSREREPKTNQPGSRESTAPGTVKPKTSGEPSRRTLNVQ